MRISFANKKNPDGLELRTKDSPAQLKKIYSALNEVLNISD